MSYGEASSSVLIDLGRYYDIYISESVIRELERTIMRKLDKSVSVEDIMLFVQTTNIRIIQSNLLRTEMLSFVSDPDDAQILQDAVDISADFLITKNMRDFDIPAIAETFHINIINTLPPMPE